MLYSFQNICIVFTTINIYSQVSPCFGNLFPKIEIGFLCKTDQFLRLKCQFRKTLLEENPVLVDKFEKNYTFFFNDEDETPIFIGMLCRASFPVTWEHYQERYMTEIMGSNWLYVLRLQSTAFQRTIKEIENPDTYEYSSLKVLSNHIQMESAFAMGEYTCSGIKTSSLSFQTASAKMKVFRERSVFDRAFPLAGKNITIWKGNKREDGSLVLPCHVSNPDIKARLYRLVTLPPQKKRIRMFIDGTFTISTNNGTNTKWIPIHEDSHINFQPHLGFVYYEPNKVSKLYRSNDLIQGTYKCSTVAPSSDKDRESVDDYDSNDNEDQSEDDVIIQLKDGWTEVPAHNSVIQPPASFNLTDSGLDGFEINCCSNSTEPPTMYLTSCFSKDMCDRASSKFVESTEKIIGADRLTVIKDNCRKSIKFSFLGLGSGSDIPMLIRCFGNGIDYVGTMIFPLERSKPQPSHNSTFMMPYLNWEDVDPDKMMSLTAKGGRNETSTGNNTQILFYENQNASFQCISSLGYFAVGQRAIINFKNGTRSVIPDNLTSLGESYITVFQRRNKFNFQVTLSANVTSISCRAPFVDSSDWVEKTLEILLEPSERVTINGFQGVEEISWTLNETDATLMCKFSGIPSPHLVKWIKDNQTIIISHKNGEARSWMENYYSHNDSSNSSTVLGVKVVDYLTHGEYTCVAQNIFGEARKTFRVFVRPSEKVWTGMCVMLGLACLTAMLGLLAVTAWSQRKALSNFKDPYEYQNFGKNVGG